jgi:hypothetical protein
MKLERYEVPLVTFRVFCGLAACQIRNTYWRFAGAYCLNFMVKNSVMSICEEQLAKSSVPEHLNLQLYIYLLTYLIYFTYFTYFIT